jgi:DNA-binding NarL/FixJ family response regulator
MTRIVLGDDHPLVRDGLRRFIEAEPDLSIVGEAADGTAAIAQVAALQPDVLVLDVSMPGRGGISALGEIRKASPATRILVLTMHADPAYVRVALAAGASGFLVKQAAGRELVRAIRVVLDGRTYIDPSLAGAGQNDRIPPPERSELAQDLSAERLSPRETEVLRDLALGFTNKEVAQRLALSVNSVETFCARLFEKLGSDRRADLVRCAIAHKLITVDDKAAVGT